MIVIIEATGTNLTSIKTAIERLGHVVVISNERKIINKASHVILPGVGTAQMGMRQLQQCQLTEFIPQLSCPVLGICLGMQLLFDYSSENDVACLGVIPGGIDPLRATPSHPVPHMGWNQVQWVVKSALSQGIDNSDYFYFVHSYAASITDSCIAQTEYSTAFASIVQKDNFFGVQFHPEKSGKVGSQLLRNFCSINNSNIFPSPQAWGEGARRSDEGLLNRSD
ncbi:imidazole glycerol phosphate synthase subunit HisH [Legionella sp. W05-934-2]|uniref:imidazole glycerol phosphate synthase subunit HisH n=1 Tax=Legionella sp. W05-934-2 TaxID=1198649 RepID=UPI003462822F